MKVRLKTPAAEPAESNPRRRAIYRLTAFLILAAALTALLRPPLPDGDPGPAPCPPPRAVYRPDGGQALSPNGPLEPNVLTGLNLGRKIRLDSAPAGLLAALPSLGGKTGAKAAATGCLTAKQRRTLNGLVMEKETCAPTRP